MWGLIIMWFFIWIYISRNFEQILDALRMKHTPRKIQAEIDPLRKWKFTNTRTSLIHSIFTGVWGCCILVKKPNLFWDCNEYDEGVIRMASCCFGYFLYDSIDLIKEMGIVKAYDILIHHAIVFGNLTYLAYNGVLVGGIVTGLSVEIANVTLHIRMILKMSGRNPANSRLYRNFRWLNLLCYCGFRFFFHWRLTDHVWKFMGNPDFPFVTLPIFVFMNILNVMIAIFSVKLVRTDFLGGWKRSSGEYSTDVSARAADD